MSSFVTSKCDINMCVLNVPLRGNWFKNPFLIMTTLTWTKITHVKHRVNQAETEGEVWRLNIHFWPIFAEPKGHNSPMTKLIWVKTTFCTSTINLKYQMNWIETEEGLRLTNMLGQYLVQGTQLCNDRSDLDKKLGLNLYYSWYTFMPSIKWIRLKIKAFNAHKIL